MLHPSEQAVDYIWQRLTDTFFSDAAKRYLAEWQPLRQALEHKPFNPDSDEYRTFRQQTLQRLAEFQEKYPLFSNPFQVDEQNIVEGTSETSRTSQTSETRQQEQYKKRYDLHN